MMPIADFLNLPRHPAYRYEYFDGVAHISPRPQALTVVLKLGRRAKTHATGPSGDFRLRSFRSIDWEGVVQLFRYTFEDHPPFCDENARGRARAVRDAISKTSTGLDGKLLRAACVVACDQKGRTIGCLIVTRVQITSIERRGADNSPTEIAPHLTWVGVSPYHQRHGVATLMLSRAIGVLSKGGWPRLYSTILNGNLPSMLWHWRTGFRLEPRFGRMPVPEKSRR